MARLRPLALPYTLATQCAFNPVNTAMSTDLSTSQPALAPIQAALWARWFPGQGIRPPAWARGLLLLATPLLLTLGALTALVGRQRALAQQRARRLEGQLVLSIGNAIVGGTGKTPACLMVVEALRELGHRPGVISRGYGRKAPDQVLVACPSELGQIDAHQLGDEPWWLAWRGQVPVAVGADRHQAALALLARAPELTALVLDDGLSQTSLRVDHHLLVLDHRGHGNHRCLPAGPLRMPWSGGPPEGLRIDAVLLREEAADPTPLTWSIRPKPRLLQTSTLTMGWTQLDLTSRDHPQKPLASLPMETDRRMVLTTIAQPERFYQTLRRQGLSWTETLRLPDHTPNPWRGLEQALQRPASAADQLLMTEKDAVKFLSNANQLSALLSRFPRGVWMLRQTMSLKTKAEDWLPAHHRPKRP